MLTEAVGWISAAVLLATLVRQVYVQWHTDEVQGVSRWLFRGQIAASLGFVVYSVLVENWVFVVTNALIAITAMVGQARFWYRSRKARSSQASSAVHKAGTSVEARARADAATAIGKAARRHGSARPAARRSTRRA